MHYFLESFHHFSLFFTKYFKTCNFGKSIALSGPPQNAFSSRTCRQLLHFCVSTVTVSITKIMLLACVRLHFEHSMVSFRASFKRPFCQKLVQIMQQNVCCCQSRSEKPLSLKSRILKIRMVFSSKFDDGKRLFRSFLT